jgi:hypothetical protein
MLSYFSQKHAKKPPSLLRRLARLCVGSNMKIWLYLIMMLSSLPSWASLEEYIRPSDQEIFTRSDVVAVVRTIKGEALPIELGGGIKVTAEVLLPIKGVAMGTKLNIYYGAGSMAARYIATLVWDEKLKGYRYYDMNYDFQLLHIDTVAQPFLNAQEISNTRGFKGALVDQKDGLYFLPICHPSKCDDYQIQFEHLQYMLRQLK